MSIRRAPFQPPRSTRKLGALIALLLGALACDAPRPLLPDPFLAPDASAPTSNSYRGKPRKVQREFRDSFTGELVRTWSEWLEPGKRAVRHGVETRFYRGGATKSERHWDMGRQSGTWRSWFEDGALESVIEFAAPAAGPKAEAPMHWYHPNGAKAASGPGIQGVRTGLWNYWYPSGAKRKTGSHLGGLKTGEWTFWTERGELEARGQYFADRRVGQWERGPSKSGPSVFTKPAEPEDS